MYYPKTSSTQPQMARFALAGGYRAFPWRDLNNVKMNGVDPFGKVVEGEPFNGFPPVEDSDLVLYLVLTSFLTMP